MKPDLHWTTAITKIEQDGIFLRGYPAEELMGRVSFGDVVYLLCMGELPETGVGIVLEAMFVASADHGATPQSALAARTVATAGSSLNAAMAAGLLAISSHHGGAIEGCMLLLQEAVNREHEGHEKGENHNKSESFKSIAEALVAEYLQQRRRLPGYGHRIHTHDPRTTRLLTLAQEQGVAGEHVAAAQAIEEALAEAAGRRLIFNLDGAIAALLCDIGFPTGLANALFMIGRLAGIAVHAYEEQTRQRPNRRIHPTDHKYDGPDVRHLEADDNNENW